MFMSTSTIGCFYHKAVCCEEDTWKYLKSNKIRKFCFDSNAMNSVDGEGREIGRHGCCYLNILFASQYCSYTVLLPGVGAWHFEQ